MRLVKLTGPTAPVWVNPKKVEAVEKVSPEFAASLKKMFEEGRNIFDYSKMPTVIHTQQSWIFVMESPHWVVERLIDH